MSITYLAEMYCRIKRANPMIPVIALGIVKMERAGNETGAIERRNQFEANYGSEMAQALDVCTLFLRMYGDHTKL